jgi:hypothetical protein
MPSSIWHGSLNVGHRRETARSKTNEQRQVDLLMGRIEENKELSRIFTASLKTARTKR